MMTTKEILIKAKDLIPDYKHWSTGRQSALSKGARPLGYGGRLDDESFCYCAHGAIAVAAGDWPEDSPDHAVSDIGRNAVQALANAINPHDDWHSSGRIVERFNDYETNSLRELHKKFDEAIAAAD